MISFLPTPLAVGVSESMVHPAPQFCQCPNNSILSQLLDSPDNACLRLPDSQIHGASVRTRLSIKG